MKRPLFAASLAYLAATAAAFFLPQSSSCIILGAAATAAILAAAGGKAGRWKEYLILPAAVALAVSVFALHSLGLTRQAQALAGKECTFQGLVVESDVKTYGTRYLVKGQAEVLPGKPFTMRLYAWEEQEAVMGQTIVCKVRFERWQEVLPNGKAAMVRGATNHVAVSQGEPQAGDRLWAAPLKGRDWCMHQVDVLFHGDVRTMVKGILFGETEDMEEETMSVFRRSGTAHILVVSGLHISILIYGLHRLFSRLIRPQGAAAATLPFLLLLAALEGFTISVLRAAIMAALWLISQIIGREYDGLTAWAAAMLGILAVCPWAVGRLSFWMSFGAVLGILLLAGPFYQLAKYVLKGPKRSNPMEPLFWEGVNLLAVSLAAQVFLFPIFLMFFHQVQVAAPLASFVVLPLLPLVMVFALGGLVLSLLLGTGAFLARALCESAAMACRLLLRFLKWVSGLSFAVVYTDSQGLLFWYGGALLFVGIVLCLRGKNWQKKALAALALCLLSLEMGLAVTSFVFRERLRVDYTQNAAVITQGGSGAVIGSVSDPWEARDVAELLRCRRVKTLQLLLLQGEAGDNKGAAALTREYYQPQLALLPPGSPLEEEINAEKTAYPQGEAYITFLKELALWLPQGAGGKAVVYLRRQKQPLGAAEGLFLLFCFRPVGFFVPQVEQDTTDHIIAAHADAHGVNAKAEEPYCNDNA